MDGNMSEKEQIESLKKWWDENASSLVIGVFLGLSVLLGGKAWISWKDTQAQNSSNIYAQMQSALKQNDVEMARSQANDLIGNYTDSGYATLAALMLAKLAMQDGELVAARSQLEWAAEHARTAQVANIARSRLVRVLIDEKEYTQADAVLSQVVDADEYRHIFAELQGDLAFSQGEMERAAAAYRDALAVLPAQASNAAYLRVKYENLAGADALPQ